MQNSKACTKCGQIKPLKDFHKLKEKHKAQCAECLKKLWRENKDRFTAYSRASYQRNKDKKRIYQKTYYQENPEKVKATKQKYVKANRQKRLDSLQKHRVKNAEQINAKKREFYAANSAKWLSYAHKRRELKQTNYLVTLKDLKKLRSEACVYCNSKENIEIDHVVPLARGGVHGIGNLAAACKKCNRSKGSKFVSEWRYTNQLTKGRILPL